MRVVYLLTTGDGSDGEPWDCLGIHATRESAEQSKREYEAEQKRPDGSTFHYEAKIETWPMQE